MTHLHLHGEHSVIDGRGLIDDYVKLAVEDHQTSIAITDHGSLASAVNLYTRCKQFGINPIIGMELYVDAFELRERNYPGHLTVLAKNEAGYRALIKCNNLAHRQFYYRPRVTLQQLIEHGFAADWIILSGCMSSPIFDWPLAEAENIVKQLAAHSGGFFLEAMWHWSADEEFKVKQDTYLERVAQLHKSTGIPIVLTNDCHYAYKEAEEYHQELLRQSREPSDLEFDGEGFYFKTIAEMQEVANGLGIPNAVDLAVEIGNSCKISIPEADHTNWYVPDITGGNPYQRIRELTEPKLDGLPEAYTERYEYELSILSQSPAILNSYLVAHDVVQWAEARNIPIAARGSMAGSLVSFLLGITNENPIKWMLSFSRAVSPARPTIPDFDLDVSSQHRAEILEYLQARYLGNIPIAAYTHYGPKGALRKILKMEGIRSPMEINELSKQLPDDWSEGDFEFTNIYTIGQNRRFSAGSWIEAVPEQYRNFVGIYKGLYSSMSVHPSGLLISGPERELEHEVPLQWIASSKALVSAFDMYTLKKIGLFKLDVLGLKTLDQIEYMERMSGAKPPDDNYDEKDILAAFGSDLLSEIFQMDGYACREVIRQIGGVESFEDIVAANTLARPGANQFAPFYRKGRQDLLNEYPQVIDVLGPTNGLILYQEQVMEICRILADFDDAEQDDVKEAIKYFRHEVFKDIAEKFTQRCQAKDINPTSMLAGIIDMSKYSFNRAHAVTYAALAYRMMWYKLHYPAVYFAAVFDAADDKQRLILESHFFGVNWLLADINLSESYTTVDVESNTIRLGLSSIKGVGPAAFDALAKARPFTSLEDLENRVERKRCNKRVIEQLKVTFACKCIGVEGKPSAFMEAFGFSLSLMDTAMSRSLDAWQQEAPRNRVGGFITDLRHFTVNKAGANQGKEMARLDITGVGGRKKCVLFPDVWAKARDKMFIGDPIGLVGEYQLSGEFIGSNAYAVE